MISVIFPVYNEEVMIEELHRRLVAVLSTLKEPFEIIAVDDGSTDKSREKLMALAPITLVMFSRNFGQNAALDAGFQVAIGDIVITIDSDLQNAPEDIPKLVEKLKNGYGTVVGWRKKRHDVMRRRLFSALANWLISKVTGIPLHDFSCALKGYRREFIDGVQLLGETFIFMPVFAHDRGAKVAEVEIRHNPRLSGVSKHHIGEMIYVLFDLLSVKFLLNYFAKPLRFFGSLALFFLILGIGSFGTAVVLKLLHIKNLSVTPLPLIGTMLTILAVLIFILGFITEILLRIYYSNKENTQYMIYEVVKNK
ncbi:glycosyltransferase family 2 protein [Candidatus Peregrinibacteria bacterium]|nr:glycosyltransferase family 2 protein [Candidatus Peregrinibacteria bacterium]